MHVKKVLLIEGCVNFAISLIKITVGLVTSSAAIIGDGIHSLTDCANNIIAWTAVNISEAPADKGHPYGHQKFEQIAVLILAILLTVVAIEILINAVERFGQPVKQSFWGLVILILALFINLALTLWERYWAKRLNSDILNADASHTLSDVLTSIAIIVGWQLASRGYYWIDSAFAMLVSGIIFYLALGLYKKAIPILVDHSAVDEGKIYDAIRNIEGIADVQRVRSRSSGKQTSADVIVTVNKNLSTLQSHDIADNIENLLSDEFNIDDIMIHIEPDSTIQK